MREFKYKRGTEYSIVVRMSDEGVVTFRDVVCPHKLASKDYQQVVKRMMDHAETQMMALLKEETNVSKAN